MDGLVDEVTVDEVKLFYGIDRELYVTLVRDLCRNPSECLQIMGLWLWLERGGYVNIISMILCLNQILINQLADEALICLRLISNRFPISSEASEIPLTHSLMKTGIMSLQYFYDNQLSIFHEVQNLVSEVYIPALSDLLEIARQGGFNTGPAQTHAASGSSPRAQPNDPLAQPLSGLSIRDPRDDTPLEERTMFATFSKGYPVTEYEVRQFFSRMFGHCIESVHMQEVRSDEQALYARIVFLRQSFIHMILNGEIKAKFTINGKHVWMRQFVPRIGRFLPCGCPSVGPSTCPHQQ